jgi:hypothetical protein
MNVHTWVSFIDRFGGKEKGRHDDADENGSKRKREMELDGENETECEQCDAMDSNGWGCTGRAGVVGSYVDLVQNVQKNPKDPILLCNAENERSCGTHTPYGIHPPFVIRAKAENKNHDQH